MRAVLCTSWRSLLSRKYGRCHADRTLATFYSLPEKERTRKTTSHLAFMEGWVATVKKKVVECKSENDKLEVLTNLYEGIAMQEFSGLNARELSAVGKLLDEFIDKIYSRLSLMTCPPDAQDDGATGTAGKGAVVEQIVAPAATASAEVGPSNQAKQGGEFSAEESGGDDESSDDETELGDTDDDDDK